MQTLHNITLQHPPVQNHTFRNNPERHRYELEVDGYLAFADYRLDGKTLFIPHVEAAPELRGKGAAGQLMRQMLTDVREKGYMVVPICSYAANWLERHPEFHDLQG